MSFFSDRFPTLSKHLSVLRESWRSQNAADRAFEPKDEHEFLPAALEIMEKPPSPGMRWLMLLTCGLFVLALIWSIIGKVDVVAVAQGRVVPSGNVKTVQALEMGEIRAIHVTNGQFVRAGELLVELDPTIAQASEAQSEQGLRSAQVLRARNDALLAFLNTGSVRFEPPEGTPPEVIATEEALLRSAVAQYEAQRASLTQQRAERRAELQAADAQIAQLEEALPFIDEQLDARRELAEQGYYSRLRLLEYEQVRAEHLGNIDIQRANAQRAEAAIGTIEAQLRALRADLTRTAMTEYAEASDQAGMASEELTMASRRRASQELRAPIDGVVQQLTVTTIGGVVQPAQAIMVIVPCTSGDANDPASCNSDVTVEAYVQNKDIGFVSEGQRVAVKLEAFNFTDYGLIEGTVSNISRDAVDQAAAPSSATNEQNQANAAPRLIYAATIRLNCEGTDSGASELCSRVQPGMSVQAEIKTGQRRIIQYLLSPISRALGEAGRER
ncbi:HlyD family type I secretion periplasmic adaptor subunit [Erythrobacter sp. EC-HK427]|uniref:HlyD family type I secretion periplasmic adaptor subunit n=1 Tax=Erythrobacter sp. EC-HK427 TaxID=2038396 RepID=UPI001257D863|nr:HlyD family type I secretion periplasmic adaptor subunit [Erythrobacter sp. EC-HK427]VVS96038.1 Secretion protein HylD [Erythrobacter sp. EC-HK427]